MYLKYSMSLRGPTSGEIRKVRMWKYAYLKIKTHYRIFTFNTDIPNPPSSLWGFVPKKNKGGISVLES